MAGAGHDGCVNSNPTSIDLRNTALVALACLDLTSLNEDDTPARIDALCDRALDPVPGLDVRPAAVCVMARFAAQAAGRVAGSGVAVAVVANFPGGDAGVGAVIDEVEAALADGADEIDVVFPYRAFLAGRADAAGHLIAMVSHACKEREHPALLKVILETGAIAARAAITAAALCAVDAGADFLKTSTGKLTPGATPQAAEALLEVIADVRHREGRSLGLKVSGGVRTVADAALYLGLAEEHLAPEPVGPANLRIGASGLLDGIVAILAPRAGAPRGAGA